MSVSEIHIESATFAEHEPVDNDTSYDSVDALAQARRIKAHVATMRLKLELQTLYVAEAKRILDSQKLPRPF